MARIKLMIVVLFAFMSIAQAQVNRYMVFFKDKAGTPFSTSTPEDFLSQRAIDRRTNQGIVVVAQDLPVTPSYVTDVQNTGATVLYKTKWMNGVLVECDAALKSTIEGLSSVQSVQYVAPGPRPAGGRIRASRKFEEISNVAANTDIQLQMLGIDDMHVAGYRGEGIYVAVLDAGFPGADTISSFDHIFNDGRYEAVTSYDFVSGSHNVFRHHTHGTNVWSTIGAYKENAFIGGAYKARFALFVTEDAATEYRVEEYNWLFAAERADSAGVDIITTSLGYRDFDDSAMNYSLADMNGQTAVISRAANIASSKGIAVIASAGNEGHATATTIGAPADAASVLSVGAVDNLGAIASFSSSGPSSDGRIKPDVAAMGSGVSVVLSNGFLGGASGTSFSGPLTAALVIGVWQMSPELTAAELLETIRSHASQFNHPDNLLGYGIPNYNYVITAVDRDKDRSISVFPNPSKGPVKIELQEVSSTPFQVSLINSKGVSSSVRVTAISEKEFTIDLSNQSPGLYVLRCQRGTQQSFHKILKID